MRNTEINRVVISKIAHALGDINEEVVYVGGAVVSLYINDPAADDVRPTKDIDLSMSVVTLGELERMRQRLTSRRFIQTFEDEVICRFRYDDVLVDFMNTKALGWAPANPWFGPGYLHCQRMAIGTQEIRLLPLSYFMATKFSAFESRGQGDPRTSHDFEDVVYVLDNRIDLVEELQGMRGAIASFLQHRFELILEDAVFREAVSAHLFYENRAARTTVIFGKLKRLVSLLKSSG